MIRFATAFVLLLSVWAVGQIPGMPDFRSARFAPIILLDRGDVGKELKLTKEQSAEIKKLAKAHQEKVQALAKAGADPNNLGAAFGSMKQLEESTQEASAKAVAVLDAGQALRFAGLRLQFVGPKLLQEAEYAKMLDLSEEQQAKIKEIAGSEMGRIMSAMQGGGGGRDAANKMKEAIKSISAEITALLTPEQAAKYKEIEGKEFGPAKKERGY